MADTRYFDALFASKFDKNTTAMSINLPVFEVVLNKRG
jgi:hypothetical protein